MAERITSGYQRLFEVRLLHHYWLDQGATLFDKIADADTRTARLLGYDVRPLLDVAPTPATARILSGRRCLCKMNTLGFLVAAPSDATIPADTVLKFIVFLRSGSWLDYTALTWRPQKVYEVLEPHSGTTYRYKENVPLLSNLTGATRGAGPDLELYLSREIPGPSPSDGVESLVSGGPALLQLTSDNPGATTQQLAGQASDFPLFVHQGDAPAIIAPAGVVGAPARGVQLSGEVSDDVFVLICLTAVRGDNDAFSFVDGAGAPKTRPPVYQVRFKNRSTIWKYMDKGTGAVNSASPNPLPLTYFGNAGTKQKPSRGDVKAEMAGKKVSRLISEIYV